MFSIQIHIGMGWIPLTTAIFEGVTIVRAKENDYIFPRTKVNGSIMFYSSDYVLLRQQTSAKVQARIMRDGVVELEGSLNLHGKWDSFVETCELMFINEDQYLPFFKVWDQEFTLPFLSASTIKVKQKSKRKEVRIPLTPNTPRPQAENNFIYDIAASGPNPTEWIYAKQIIETPSDGWINDLENPNYIPGTFPIYIGYSLASASIQTVTTAIPFFYKLSEIIKFLANQCGVEFNNPTICDYLAAKPDLTRLLIAAKDNLLNRTIFAKDKKLSLSKLLQIMKAAFNLDWYLNGGSLIFKHPTQNNTALPLPQDYPAHFTKSFKGIDWSTDKNQYSYSVDVPFKEVWETEPTINKDFDGVPITYDVVSDASIKIDFKIQNNLKALMLADDGDDSISNDGFCMVAVNNSNEVISKTGILTRESLINGGLSVSQLQNDHHINGDRYLASGFMNGVYTSFRNPKRLKSAAELIMPATVNDFNFNYLVETNAGACEIASVSEDVTKGSVKLKVVF